MEKKRDLENVHFKKHRLASFSVLFYLCQIPAPCLLTRTSNDFSKSCFNVMDCCVPVKKKKKKNTLVYSYIQLCLRGHLKNNSSFFSVQKDPFMDFT